MTTKQEYRPVTVDELVFITEYRQPKDGEFYLGLRPHEVFLKEKLNPFTGERNVIICQPINSSIEGIPYYQTEEETVDIDKLARAAAGITHNHRIDDEETCFNGQKVAVYRAFIEGYKAAKAKKFTEDDILNAVRQAREIDRIKTHTSFSEIDYCFTPEDIITSLRKPRRIVSAKAVMEEVCASVACMCSNYMEKRYCPSLTKEQPVRYTKEIDGKTLEFIKLDIKYE